MRSYGIMYLMLQVLSPTLLPFDYNYTPNTEICQAECCIFPRFLNCNIKSHISIGGIKITDFLRFSEFSWCNAYFIFKDSQKCFNAGKTAFLTDILYTFICCQEKLFCFFYSQIGDVFMKAC